jgi:hypothetical protein
LRQQIPEALKAMHDFLRLQTERPAIQRKSRCSLFSHIMAVRRMPTLLQLQDMPLVPGMIVPEDFYTVLASPALSGVRAPFR